MTLICMTLITQYNILLIQTISEENRKQVIPVIKYNGFRICYLKEFMIFGEKQ